MKKLVIGGIIIAIIVVVSAFFIYDETPMSSDEVLTEPEIANPPSGHDFSLDLEESIGFGEG